MELFNKHLRALGGFACLTSGKLILLGEVRDARELLVILHEIGHIYDEVHGSLSPLDYEKISQRERNAWAFSLKTIRKLGENLKTNFLEPFKDREEALQYIYNFLAYYRDWIFKSISGCYPEYVDPEYLSEDLKKFFGKGKHS